MNHYVYRPLRCALCTLALLLAMLYLLPLTARADDDAPPYPLLTLVNCWNTLPEGHEPNLMSIGDGHKIDSRAYNDFKQMMADCRAAGLHPVVRSSYRTNSTQTSLYENKIRRLMRADRELGYISARAEAATVVAYPGTSEHQLGLALDIVDRSYQALETDQENTPVQQWLMQNSWRYGFILRYPSDKCAITGIIYEPWHYRYVGRGVAAEIYESGLCFEEYIAEYISPQVRQVRLYDLPAYHLSTLF